MTWMAGSRGGARLAHDSRGGSRGCASPGGADQPAPQTLPGARHDSRRPGRRLRWPRCAEASSGAAQRLVGYFGGGDRYATDAMTAYGRRARGPTRRTRRSCVSGVAATTLAADVQGSGAGDRALDRNRRAVPRSACRCTFKRATRCCSRTRTASADGGRRRCRRWNTGFRWRRRLAALSEPYWSDTRAVETVPAAATERCRGHAADCSIRRVTPRRAGRARRALPRTVRSRADVQAVFCVARSHSMMRIAMATWTSRQVGGAETYISRTIAAFLAAGHEVVLCYESDDPTIGRASRFPSTLTAIAVATRRRRRPRTLREWRPDVMYVHGLSDPAFEERLQSIAPSVLFAHAYYGTCISGDKTHQLPVIQPCARRFGPACLALYYPRRCGGLNPVTFAGRLPAAAAPLRACSGAMPPCSRTRSTCGRSICATVRRAARSSTARSRPTIRRERRSSTRCRCQPIACASRIWCSRAGWIR